MKKFKENDEKQKKRNTRNEREYLEIRRDELKLIKLNRRNIEIKTRLRIRV